MSLEQAYVTKIFSWDVSDPEASVELMTLAVPRTVSNLSFGDDPVTR